MIGLCLEQRARLKRRQARLIALKDKLRTAKNTLALTRKSPFNLAKGNSQNAGKTDGGTPKSSQCPCRVYTVGKVLSVLVECILLENFLLYS